MKFLCILKNLLHPACIIASVLALAIPFTIYLIPKTILLQLDATLPIPLFLLQTIFAVILCAVLFKDFKAFFKSLNASPAYLLGIFAFAVSATIFAGTQIEARHRVQSDESVFLSLAQNMYYNHQSTTCTGGTFENGSLQCYEHSNSFKAKGLSWLYVLGMPFLGNDLHWAFSMQLSTLFFTVLLFFFALLAWTKSAPFALLSTVILTVQPTLLFQFRSLSVEPLYILLLSLSLLLCKFAAEKNTWKHWALAALCIAFFAQTRQETVFCYAAFLFIASPYILNKKDFKAPVFFIVLSLFSLPILITISSYQNFGFQGGEFSAHGHFFEDLIKNWNVMTSSKMDSKGLPENPFLPYFNYFALAGAIVLVLKAILEWIHKKFDKNSITLIFLLLLGIQTFMIFENVSGDFNIQINQRYSLVMFPAMAFLGAYPFYTLFTFLCKKTDLKQLTSICVVIMSVLLISNTYLLKNAFNENIMYNRNHLTTEEVEIWKWLNEKNKTDARDRFFIYARPYHFIGYGVSAVHYNLINHMSPLEIQKLIDKYNGEVYYIRGLDCWDSKTYHKKATETRIPTVCENFERNMELVSEKNILLMNSYWIQIAKFKGKKSYNERLVLSRAENADVNDSIAFDFGEKSAKPWVTKVNMDGLTASFPYVYGTKLFEIPKAKMPGYQKLQVEVLDTITQKLIAKHTAYRLEMNDYVTKLSALRPIKVELGYGSLKIDKTIENRPFHVAGESYPEGLGMHWPLSITFDVSLYDSLSAFTGLDEESLCSEGGTLQIYGDSQKLQEVPVGYKTVSEIGVSLKDINTLSIEAKPNGSKDCGHLDFLMPLLYKNLANLPAIEVSDVENLEIDDKYRK